MCFYHVAAEESVHLLVAVDALWSSCLRRKRADQKPIRHRIHQVGQLLFLFASHFQSQEKLRLGSDAVIVAALDQNHEKQDETEDHHHCELVIFVPHHDVKTVEGPNK